MRQHYRPWHLSSSMPTPAPARVSNGTLQLATPCVAIVCIPFLVQGYVVSLYKARIRLMFTHCTSPETSSTQSRHRPNLEIRTSSVSHRTTSKQCCVAPFAVSYAFDSVKHASRARNILAPPDRAFPSPFFPSVPVKTVLNSTIYGKQDRWGNASTLVWIYENIHAGMGGVLQLNMQ